ncbi:MAG TPA: response regulator [Patescibacteria group bacterium]|nr:response regulator [Patescibacteria group bacterium]
MRALIAEDDLASRIFLKKLLSKYGDCDVAVDGLEAIDAYLMALKEQQPYNLICLDIMMPKVDGLKTLKAIRDIEQQNGVSEPDRVKIIMTTALNDTETIMAARELGCEGYAWKPIEIEKFLEVLRTLAVIS